MSESNEIVEESVNEVVEEESVNEVAGKETVEEEETAEVGPKRTKMIKSCDWPTAQKMEEAGEQVDSGDFMILQLGATSLSLVALFLKRRLLAWISLIFAIATLANMRMYKLKSFKDFLMCIVPPIMAVSMGYFGSTKTQWK